MTTLLENETDSIIEQVRRLKEANAEKYGFDVRAIAAAARANQRKHPERMVTRVPTNAGPADGEVPLTRPVSKADL